MAGPGNAAVDHLGIRELLALPTDARILFVTRALRMFSFGFLGVVLALYLRALGLSDPQLGLLLTLALLGDAAFSLWVTAVADKFGRRRLLMLGAGLKFLSALPFGLAQGPQFLLLLFGATIGVISPSGNEVGPFMALEQSILTQLVSGAARTQLFAWYSLCGYFLTALGALVGGSCVELLMTSAHLNAVLAYKVLVALYGLFGAILFVLFSLLSEAVELPPMEQPALTTGLLPAMPASEDEEDESTWMDSLLCCFPKSVLGLKGRSRRVALGLSFLFTLDSFGGGLIAGTLLAYWFSAAWQVDEAGLGGVLATANVLSGISSLAAGWVASKVGLINTMVVTHLPSNIFTVLIPLMPTLPLALTMTFLRFSISQMDVAPRQSYVASVVRPQERTVTIGLTNVVRSLGACLGPTVTGLLKQSGHFGLCFILAGSIKIVYDLLLLATFQKVTPDNEKKPAPLTPAPAPASSTSVATEVAAIDATE